MIQAIGRSNLMAAGATKTAVPVGIDLSMKRSLPILVNTSQPLFKLHLSQIDRRPRPNLAAFDVRRWSGYLLRPRHDLNFQLGNYSSVLKSTRTAALGPRIWFAYSYRTYAFRGTVGALDGHRPITPMKI